MPPRSRSDVSFAKKTLPYPIFAADFDPYNRGYLVVGGGGGESKTGVPNQISVLDVSNRAVITNAVDIELSRDEDSVQSLGTMSTKEGLVVFAGINSGSAEQEAGKNEHLRSFSVAYPPRKKQKTDEATDEKLGDWKLLGKQSLFKAPSKSNKDTYQRLLRLSPSRKRESGCNRIGAIATRSAKEAQIVVFSATNTIPDQKDVLATINLPEGQEAVDLDIAEIDINEYSMAYCTDYDIHEQAYQYDFSKKKVEKTPKGPRRVYQLPLPNAEEGQKSRPKWRALRFLNSQNVVGLLNKPNKGGAELRIFHLYPTGPAIQIQQHKLPSRIKQAVAMDVCALGADKDGNEQVAIAVAGSDISIEVFTTNYQRHTDTVSPLRTYLTIRDVHGHQITRLAFSPFHPPDPKTQTEEQQKLTQFIRLASTSYGNTVVVDTLPLQQFDPKKKDSRFLLSHPSDEFFTKWTYIAVISMVVVVTAFLAQSFIGGFGALDRGPFSLLPQSAREFLDRPAVLLGRQAEWVPDPPISSTISGPPIATPAPGKLQSLIASHKSHPEHSPTEDKAFIFRPDTNAPSMDTGYSIAVYVHEDKEAFLNQDTTNAKHWEEMKEHEKERWRHRLKHAGQWLESEGESVLKGVLFSEYVGLIGGYAGPILREL